MTENTDNIEKMNFRVVGESIVTLNGFCEKVRNGILEIVCWQHITNILTKTALYLKNMNKGVFRLPDRKQMRMNVINHFL